MLDDLPPGHPYYPGRGVSPLDLVVMSVLALCVILMVGSSLWAILR